MDISMEQWVIRADIPALGLSLCSGDLLSAFEVVCLDVLQVPVFAALAFVGHAALQSQRLGAAANAGLSVAIGACMAYAPFAVLNTVGALSSRSSHFVLSFHAVLGTFRWVELVTGTGPKGIDRSSRAFALYLGYPADVLFDDEGNLKSIPGSRLQYILDLVWRLVPHCIVATAVLSIGKATAFQPFLAPSAQPARMPLFGFPWSLPAIYLQAAYVYCMLATSMLFHRMPLALFGIDTLDAMRSPLLLSTSVREFWGRRWNLIIHGQMKRIFFVPLSRGPAVARHLAGLAAFVASGVFHEYMWLAVNWIERGPYVPWKCVLFFVVQFALCAAQVALVNTPLGQKVAQLPAPCLTVLTTLIILPVGPLFLEGLHLMFLDSCDVFPTVELSSATGTTVAHFGPRVAAACLGAAGAAAMLRNRRSHAWLAKVKK